MADLQTKLNATKSSVDSIEIALENKSGQNLDSTPLSDYDDIINALDILDSTLKNYIDNNFNSDGSTYYEKLQNSYSTAVDLRETYTNKILGRERLTPTNNKLHYQISSFMDNLQNEWLTLCNALEDALPALGTIVRDPNNDFDTMYEVSQNISDLGSSSDGMMHYINGTGETMYVCNPSGTMTSITQSVSSGSGSTIGCQHQTVRGLMAGTNGSYSYSGQPCVALWGSTDSEKYPNMQGYYIYRLPSSTISVFTDYDGTSTRSLYGPLCGYTSSCLIGDV